MGKLRLVPKVQPMDPDNYRDLVDVLKEARRAGEDKEVYFDLDPHEVPADVRKDLLFVAQKEGITLEIRKLRKAHCLALDFKGSDTARMTPEEYRNRIMQTLGDHDLPLQRGEIIEKAGLSPGAWNPRIRELLATGLVTRVGERRESAYQIA